eukprot:TRINITY_DN23330_c0_g1_i2.p1 TRINITY_DN23330_c0_g1~~TRINITY_DN23330_c0_g1_i2.p1  ORF type:complete len:838 (-),score=132.41 TRINITY_DN23330_c0_g1_i2:315-2693(-)
MATSRKSRKRRDRSASDSPSESSRSGSDDSSSDSRRRRSSVKRATTHEGRHHSPRPLPAKGRLWIRCMVPGRESSSIVVPYNPRLQIEELLDRINEHDGCGMDDMRFNALYLASRGKSGSALHRLSGSQYVGEILEAEDTLVAKVFLSRQSHSSAEVKQEALSVSSGSPGRVKLEPRSPQESSCHSSNDAESQQLDADARGRRRLKSEAVCEASPPARRRHRKRKRKDASSSRRQKTDDGGSAGAPIAKRRRRRRERSCSLDRAARRQPTREPSSGDGEDQGSQAEVVDDEGFVDFPAGRSRARDASEDLEVHEPQQRERQVRRHPGMPEKPMFATAVKGKDSCFVSGPEPRLESAPAYAVGKSVMLLGTVDSIEVGKGYVAILDDEHDAALTELLQTAHHMMTNTITQLEWDTEAILDDEEDIAVVQESFQKFVSAKGEDMPHWFMTARLGWRLAVGVSNKKKRRQQCAKLALAVHAVTRSKMKMPRDAPPSFVRLVEEVYRLDEQGDRDRRGNAAAAPAEKAALLEEKEHMLRRKYVRSLPVRSPTRRKPPPPCVPGDVKTAEPKSREQAQRDEDAAAEESLIGQWREVSKPRRRGAIDAAPQYAAQGTLKTLLTPWLERRSLSGMLDLRRAGEYVRWPQLLDVVLQRLPIVAAVPSRSRPTSSSHFNLRTHLGSVGRRLTMAPGGMRFGRYCARARCANLTTKPRAMTSGSLACTVRRTGALRGSMRGRSSCSVMACIIESSWRFASTRMSGASVGSGVVCSGSTQSMLLRSLLCTLSSIRRPKSTKSA